MPETKLPECVAVLMVEQFIFYLAGGGLLLLVGGPLWTIAPMPTSALLAGALAFLMALGALVVRVVFPDLSPKATAAVQQLAMAWIFAYTVQYIVFALVLRLQETGDDTGDADSPFISMFNAERVQPYGLGATTLHMVVSLVLSILLLALFTSAHYFLRDREIRGIETSLLAVLFFAEAQFFLFHSEQEAAAVRQNERCTRVLCNVMHTAVALGVLAGLMTEHFAMELTRERFQEHRHWPLALAYLLVHVLAIPLGGFLALHLVSWLHKPGFYVANIVFLSLLLLTRLYDAWQQWRMGMHRQAVKVIETQNEAPFTQPTFVTGTQQPRYFFKRVGEGKTKRKKSE